MSELVVTTHRIFFDKKELVHLRLLTQVCKVRTRSGREEVCFYGTTGYFTPTEGGVGFYVWKDADLLVEFVSFCCSFVPAFFCPPAFSVFST